MSRSLRIQALTGTCFLLLAGVQAKFGSAPPTVDPFADPAHDVNNPLRYITSNSLTGVALVLYLVVALYTTFATIRYGARYMLAMVIGAYTFSIGLCLRFVLHKKPDSKGVYIAEYLFVVLSPCAFIAADYVLLARLARFLGTGQHLLLPPNRLARVFIASDISTFLIQAIGGSIAVSANDLHQNQIGANVFLAGLCAQLASFLTFTLIYITWIIRNRSHSPEVWNSTRCSRGWKLVMACLLISCMGILVRSVYRVAEEAQGFHGHLATTEAFFYGLDTFPLWLAIAVYVPFWPGRLIPEASVVTNHDENDVKS